MTPFQQGHFINQLTGNLFASSVGVVSVISLFIIMFSFLGRFGERELLGRNEPPYIHIFTIHNDDVVAMTAWSKATVTKIAARGKNNTSTVELAQFKFSLTFRNL